MSMPKYAHGQTWTPTYTTLNRHVAPRVVSVVFQDATDTAFVRWHFVGAPLSGEAIPRIAFDAWVRRNTAMVSA